MPSYRPGVVETIISQRPGLQRVTLVGGDRAYVLTQLVGPVAVGDRVVVNTTAVELGLGTGGWHVVHWNLSRESWSYPGKGHVMKLRYTSLQVNVGASEEVDGQPPLALAGVPVVACGVHSQLAAVAVAFKHAAPSKRLAYVMTDGGALPIAISDLVWDLRGRGLVDFTVTCGQAFGGDHEAVNVHTGLLVALRHGADAMVAGIGPGVVGTGTTYGHTGLDAVTVLGAARALGGRAILAQRVSEADERERHQGRSHHTSEVLELLGSPVETPEPDSFTPDVVALFDRYGLRVTTMGRPASEDRTFFQHAAAAGAAAAREVTVAPVAPVPDAGAGAVPDAGAAPDAGPMPDAGPAPVPGLSGPLPRPGRAPTRAGLGATPGPAPVPTPGAIPGPGPAPTPGPIPGPGPAPTPGPIPTPEPGPGPVPTPEPGPVPTPEPGPLPGPVPTPEPGPLPEPTPEPLPEPIPGPGPGPAPQPGPGPLPEPTPEPVPGPGPGPEPIPGPGSVPAPAREPQEPRRGPIPEPGPGPLPGPGPEPVVEPVPAALSGAAPMAVSVPTIVEPIAPPAGEPLRPEEPPAPDAPPFAEPEPPAGEPPTEDEVGAEIAPEPASAKKRAVRSAVEWVLIVAAALAVAFVVKTFLIQAFWIPSASMDPMLHTGDRVLVNKLSYRAHEVNRGDIVVFERPPCDQAATYKDLIKRVVALGGERVEGRNGDVFVNGRRLREPYLPESVRTSDFGPVRVPPGRVWVMGDNRNNSKDSRFLCNNEPTFIDEDDIVGRAFVRVWPLSDLTIL